MKLGYRDNASELNAKGISVTISDNVGWDCSEGHFISLIGAVSEHVNFTAARARTLGQDPRISFAAPRHLQNHNWVIIWYPPGHPK